MCNAACIDEAINRVHIEMCIFSELIDMSEMLSSCLSWSLMFWTTCRVHGFPRHAEQNTIRIFHFFLPRATLESLLYSPGFWDYSNNLVPETRIVAKRDNMLSLSPLTNQVKSFPEIFSTFQMAFLRKEKNGCIRWLRENVVSFMRKKRCNKLCHPSRVQLPFVKMSASWFMDSTYLIWTFGSRLILSNDQSRATLWVRDTCLFVGLLPLMIVCITDSLSSKMYNCDSFAERCAFEGTWSMFDRSIFWSNTCSILGVIRVLTPVSRVHAWVGFGILLVVPSTSMVKSHQSNAGKPSIRNPASKDMISDSVELWDTDVCFLHTQLIGTNIRLPKMHKTPPDVDFESWRSPAKSESWNNPNRECWAAFPTWQCWRWSLVKRM